MKVAISARGGVLAVLTALAALGGCAGAGRSEQAAPAPAANADAGPVTGGGEAFVDGGSCSGWTYVLATAPGADGAWGTSDDVLGRRTDYRLDPTAGRVTSETVADAPGTDGVWGTADDVLSSWRRRDYDGQSLASWWSFDGPGPDAKWQTSDDALATLTTFAYDSQGRVKTETAFGAPGPDGAWSTADDVVAMMFAFGSFAYGQPTRSWVYDAPGPDGHWTTADDHVVAWQSLRLDASQRWLDQLVDHAGPGADGVWGNDDDDVQTVIDAACDGVSTRTDRTYSAPGPDGVWFTPDDTQTSFGTLHGCGIQVCRADVR